MYVARAARGNIVRPCHPAGQAAPFGDGQKEKRRPRLAIRQACGGRVERVATAHLCVHERVSRGKGGSIVRTAAYNARERLVDERTGEVWDYRHLGETLASGTYAPKDAPEFVHDLQRLVNQIERAEKRSDAQLAINFDIALPHEMTLEENRRLGQDFVREEFMRRGYVARMDIHAPAPQGDDRNIHMHVWATLRKIGPEGFAPTKSEQQEQYRNRHEYVEQLREKWERLANRHLERNGYEARIDMRSLKEQGILDREPEQHRGPTVTAMQREGKVSDIADEILQRKQDIAELRSLSAEEKRIDAEIIDLQAARAEREARAAARGRTDDIRQEPAVQPDDAAAKGRVDDIRPDTASRDFSRAAAEATEPAREAVQTPEASAAPSAPEPANMRVTEPESGVRDADKITSRIFGGLANAAEKFVDWLGDMLFPAPPPTPDQAERMVRAAEENQQAHEQTAQAHERTEAHYWLVEEARRRAAEREAEERAKTAAERYGRPRAQEWDNDRERDRGYELER